ncbi:hypothetical protein CO670_19415 [Rhizobium sp. J15]|uniref:hypothetical protein n=1 Tax=Rhizobium sp. J15 TaxID=2035450 RepID=UPI000BE8404A|nr:hypothetical protein [Rhizobium sp. J15]PDT15190.1 hypothetical protein CO670_19415 [Rhizobium sp. J15]
MFDDAVEMMNRTMPAATGHFFPAACKWNIEAYKAIARFQVELLTFYGRRLQLYQAFLDDLVESVELHDTFEVVADFTQNAIAEGPRESARLARIISRMGSSTTKVMRELADDTIEDMGAQTCS